MASELRIVVLLLVTIILGLGCLLEYTRAEVLMVRRQVAGNRSVAARSELSCVYNGPQEESVGLAWLLPAAVRPVHQVYQKWRHKSRDGLRNISVESENWTVNSSLHVTAPNPFPPVLDDRWNSFPELWTEGEKWISAVAWSTDRVHVSVLARAPATLLVSGVDSPATGAAYLLHISSNTGLITRCPRGISGQHFSDWQCQILNKTSVGDVLRGGLEWVHLTVSLAAAASGGLVLELHASHSAGQPVLTATDPEPLLQHSGAKFLSLRTDEGSGRWRVHDYNVLLPHPSKSVEFIHVHELSSKYQSCLHLHYFLAPGFGSATVTVGSTNLSKQLHAHDTWQPLRLELWLTAPEDNLVITPPPRRNESLSPVFALSEKSRVCGEGEFAISRISVDEKDLKQLNNATCVDLKSNEAVTVRDKLESTALFGACTGLKFGSYCNITCGKTWDKTSCSGKVVCTAQGCSCLKNFQSSTLWSTTSCSKARPTNKSMAWKDMRFKMLSSIRSTLNLSSTTPRQVVLTTPSTSTQRVTTTEVVTTPSTEPSTSEDPSDTTPWLMELEYANEEQPSTALEEPVTRSADWLAEQRNLIIVLSVGVPVLLVSMVVSLMVCRRARHQQQHGTQVGHHSLHNQLYWSSIQQEQAAALQTDPMV